MSYEFSDLEVILKRLKCEESGGHRTGIMAATLLKAPLKLREPVSSSEKCMSCDAIIHTEYPKLGK